MKDLLDKLDNENKQELKEFKVEKDEGLDEIIYWFEKLIHQPSDFDSFIQFNCESFPKKYFSDAITNFSLMLRRYYSKFNTPGSTPYNHLHSSSVGGYLKALVNRCSSKKYVLYTTSEVNYKLSAFTSFKGKQVTIIGDVGYATGCRMEGGKLIIQGNTGDDLGKFMYGGLIIVTGTAYSFSNDFSSDCPFEIIVENNGAEYVDYCAKKQKTRISGKFPAKELSYIRSIFRQAK